MLIVVSDQLHITSKERTADVVAATKNNLHLHFP